MCGRFVSARKRLELLEGPWPFSLDAKSPAVVLGTLADCARVSRAARNLPISPHHSRLSGLLRAASENMMA